MCLLIPDQRIQLSVFLFSSLPFASSSASPALFLHRHRHRPTASWSHYHRCPPCSAGLALSYCHWPSLLELLSGPLPVSSHLFAPAQRCTLVSLLGPWTWNRFPAIPFAVPLVTSVRHQMLVELTYSRQPPGRAVAQSWTGRRWGDWGLAPPGLEWVWARGPGLARSSAGRRIPTEREEKASRRGCGWHCMARKHATRRGRTGCLWRMEGAWERGTSGRSGGRKPS